MSSTRENSEALNVPDTTRKPYFQRVDEKVHLEEQATVVSTNTYGDSFILGSASNGVLGTDELGSTNRVLTIVSIVNPNNIFRERFRDSTFEDSGNTTGDWSDTVGTLDLTNTEVAQSSSVALNNGTITHATLLAEASSGDLDDITYYLSADGGSNFEEVTRGTEHAFTNTGTDLRFKLVAAGSVTVTFIRIEYR